MKSSTIVNFLSGKIMRIILLAILSVLSFVGFAQHDHEKPFVEDDIMLKENFNKLYPELAPKIEAEEAKLEAFTKDFVANEYNNASRADVDYIIPIVFHILHENGVENITDTEVYDAVRILNEDFQKTNSDISQVVPRFQNIVGDAKIEFRLARKDPQGNATNGIDRIISNRTNNAGENSKLNPWPRNTYLNVWIVKSIGSGAAGYTFLPSTAHFRSSTDGIILLYTYFSSQRTGSETRSRALTHEIGHWLNLPHTWGSGNTPGDASNCSKDDGVSDTPLTIGWRSCNANGTSCGSFDNVQNFMEYSYCSNMFTQGQVARMTAALNSGTAERNALVSNINNRKAGVLDIDYVDFGSSSKFVCINEGVTFSDKTLYDAVSWEWEFEGGTPSTSTSETQLVSYSKSGLYKVKLTVSDAKGKKYTRTILNYMVVKDNVGNFLPFIESFESNAVASPLNWAVENEDNDEVFWKVDKGVAFTGEYYLKLENIKQKIYQVEGIVSAPIDMSNVTNPTLNFYVATASKTSGTLNGQSKLRVYYSVDCGEKWNLKYSGIALSLDKGKKSNIDYVPQAQSDWLLVTVSNFTSSDKVQNGIFKFEVENLGDNNFYLDNININGTFDDVPVLEFPSNNLDSVASNVFIDWKAVPSVDFYEYELSDKSDFSNIIYTGKKQYLGTSPSNDDTRFYAANLTKSTTYYWRVRALDGSKTSNWSTEWSFTVSSTGTGLEYIDGGSSVGVESLSGNDGIFSYNIFPNPSYGSVEIELQNSDDLNAEIMIISLQGQVVWENQLKAGNTSLTVPEGSLQKGIYIVSVSVNGKIKTKKLIIQ